MDALSVKMSTNADDIEPTRVLPHLFLGSKAHARDRALLQRLGITHILNVRPPAFLSRALNGALTRSRRVLRSGDAAQVHGPSRWRPQLL